MLGKALKKLLRPWSKQASERMTNERLTEREQAEELTPGHSDRGTQAGIFTAP